MAIKIVQNVNRISTSAGAASTSNPIALKSGYIRISTGATSVYVETGGNPIATVNSFEVTSASPEVLKERIARQSISGITTGNPTVINFDINSGNPFLIGDFVTIQNGLPVGVNTEHKLVTGLSNDSVTVDYNTSSIVGVITTSSANIARSVKVSAITSSGSQNVSITEIVQLVTE